ncbi:rhomboid family intramembrane serine protease [Priestia megaterium]|uniref:Rhomboid family intramembrane serine protease n=1 Tax=Priestia megaterium TaxID=1404 RepID=A0A6M6E8T0_PRIMG|nr:rhomboid family intramembrane serine protease [Priestia megaterium]QJX80967.1 rhomboid family intramembrane serine protease [Priestia megaterium]
MDIFLRKENFKEFVSAYPITTLLILADLVAYFGVAFISMTDKGAAADIFNNYIFDGQMIGKGEWYRLITGNFLHIGITHLLFNVFATYVFAPFLEKLLGKVKFLLCYLLLGIGTGTLNYLMNPFFLGVGASGALFGLMGIYIFICIGKPTFFSKETKQGIFGLVATSLLSGLLFENVGWLGHLGGLVSGILLGILLVFSMPQLFSSDDTNVESSMH